MAAFLRSFLGLMVSLLALTRRVPLESVRIFRSAAAIAACGIDVTVSVSTVIFLRAGSAKDFGSTLAIDEDVATRALVGDISFLEFISEELLEDSAMDLLTWNAVCGRSSSEPGLKYSDFFSSELLFVSLHFK